MAEGWGATAGNSAVDTVCGAYTWVKAHVGAPGSAGTSNAATETTRKQVTESAASGGIRVTTADLTWTNVAGTEDWTHFTRWTASSAGTFGFSGTITMNALTAGDTATVPSGSMSTSVTLAS